MKLLKSTGHIIDLNLVDETFESCRQLLQGGYIESIRCGLGLLLVDEDGRIKKLQFNAIASLLLHQDIVGDAIFLENETEITYILGD